VTRRLPSDSASAVAGQPPDFRIPSGCGGAAMARSRRAFEPKEPVMSKMPSRRLTEQERAERRRRDRERLQHAAKQLLSSNGWQRWVRVRSQAGLGRLSISNQLMVAFARPDATFVAGFNAWLGLGYAVRRGECAIAIIAPLPVKDRDRLTGEETGDTLMLFKTVFVFDRAQVEPIDGREQAPLGPPCEPLTGDSHAHLLTPMRLFAHWRRQSQSESPVRSRPARPSRRRVRQRSPQRSRQHSSPA
jgi:hypothetical protein